MSEKTKRTEPGEQMPALSFMEMYDKALPIVIYAIESNSLKTTSGRLEVKQLLIDSGVSEEIVQKYSEMSGKTPKYVPEEAEQISLFSDEEMPQGVKNGIFISERITNVIRWILSATEEEDTKITSAVQITSALSHALNRYGRHGIQMEAAYDFKNGKDKEPDSAFLLSHENPNIEKIINKGAEYTKILTPAKDGFLYDAETQETLDTVATFIEHGIYNFTLFQFYRVANGLGKDAKPSPVELQNKLNIFLELRNMNIIISDDSEKTDYVRAETPDGTTGITLSQKRLLNFDIDYHFVGTGENQIPSLYNVGIRVIQAPPVYEDAKKRNQYLKFPIGLLDTGGSSDRRTKRKRSIAHYIRDWLTTQNGLTRGKGFKMVMRYDAMYNSLQLPFPVTNQAQNDRKFIAEYLQKFIDNPNKSALPFTIKKISQKKDGRKIIGMEITVVKHHKPDGNQNKKA